MHFPFYFFCKKQYHTFNIISFPYCETHRKKLQKNLGINPRPHKIWQNCELYKESLDFPIVTFLKTSCALQISILKTPNPFYFSFLPESLKVHILSLHLLSKLPELANCILFPLLFFSLENKNLKEKNKTLYAKSSG